MYRRDSVWHSEEFGLLRLLSERWEIMEIGIECMKRDEEEDVNESIGLREFRSLL